MRFFDVNGGLAIAWLALGALCVLKPFNSFKFDFYWWWEVWTFFSRSSSEVEDEGEVV